MIAQEKEYLDSKAFNKLIFDKSIDEAELHFKIFEREFRMLTNEFLKQTKSYLDNAKKEYEERQELNYNFNRLKSKLKVSSKSFEDLTEALIKIWRVDIKESLK